jgi:hypothetical protein
MAKVKISVELELEDHTFPLPPPYREGVYYQDKTKDGDWAVFGSLIPKNIPVFLTHKKGVTRVLILKEPEIKKILQQLLD